MSNAAITVEGFVANSPEIRNVTGHRVVDISVPHTPQRKVDGGGWEDSGPTTWYQATFWDEHGDVVLQTVDKSSLVTISGMPQVEAYIRSDGSAGARVIIKNPTMALVVRRPKAGAPAAQPPAGPTGQSDWEQPAAGGDDVWVTPGNYNDETPF